MIQRNFAVALALASALAAGVASAQEVKVKRSDLPAAVEKTLAASSQDGKVIQLTKEKENGKLTYEAEILTDGHTKTVEMDDTGAVLEIEAEVTLDSLPAQVKAGLLAKAGAAKIVKVESVTRSGNLVAYEADVSSGGKKSEIKVDANGH